MKNIKSKKEKKGKKNSYPKYQIHLKEIFFYIVQEIFKSTNLRNQFKNQICTQHIYTRTYFLCYSIRYFFYQQQNHCSKCANLQERGKTTRHIPQKSPDHFKIKPLRPYLSIRSSC